MSTIVADPSPVTDAPAGPAAEQRGWPRQALTIILARWPVIVAALAALVLAAVIYLRTTTYEYTATLRATAAPSSLNEPSGMDRLGGLASLAGIPGSSTTATPFKLYLEGFYAREVADRLSRDRSLMRTVFAREWDGATRGWREPTSFTSGLKRGVYNILGIPRPAWKPPSGARLQEYIAEEVVVTESVKTPLVTVTFNAVDSQFAVRFLQQLDQTTDNYLREQAARRTRGNIAYLSDKLRVVTLAEQRQALFSALSDQERELMLANSAEPYAAQPFGAVTSSLIPTKPRPALLLVGAVVAGLLIGVTLALVLGPTRRMRAAAADEAVA